MIFLGYRLWFFMAASVASHTCTVVLASAGKKSLKASEYPYETGTYQSKKVEIPTET